MLLSIGQHGRRSNPASIVPVCALALLLILSPGSDLAAQSLEPDVFSVSIESVASTFISRLDTIDVKLTTSTELGGFDFKIGLESNGSTVGIPDIVEILPGEFIDSCRWEMFNTHRIETSLGDNRPSSLWQVVALPEMIPDSTRPICFSPAGEMNIFKIVLATGHAYGARIYHPERDSLDLFFFWEDCGDNSISSGSGSELFVMSQIFDSDGRTLADSSSQAKGGRLLPSGCPGSKENGRIKPRILFRNGLVTEAPMPERIPNSTE